MKYKTQIIVVIVTIVLSLLACAMGFYVDDYYKADTFALEALNESDNVQIKVEDDNIAFIPENIKAGLIFYPGGKVEFTSYSPLLKELAKEDILCVLVRMPLNLAVLDMDAAKGIPSMYKEVKEWYIGGHSLGGSMAASYLATTTDTSYEGLVLLASYSTEDFSNKDLDVISIYGSEDGVLNLEKYNEYFANLPQDTSEFVIEGGNHAQFASYGEQNKDGKATISLEEQILQTKNYLLKFFD